MGVQAEREGKCWGKNLNERKRRDEGDNWEEDRDHRVARQGPEHPG